MALNLRSTLIAAPVLITLAILAAPAAYSAAVENYDIQGEKVRIRKTYKDGDTIRFCLTRANSVKNVKWIKLLNKDGHGVALLEINGKSDAPVCATVSREALPGGFRYEMWKRRLLFFDTYLNGVDVTYPGLAPLARLDVHWLGEN
ncbi:MAG: hypothetical protein HY751_05890 [Nitrospinae bacterium]|nr:hypothetical protein [Nitrospinota bacterium]